MTWVSKHKPYSYHHLPGYIFWKIPTIDYKMFLYQCNFSTIYPIFSSYVTYFISQSNGIFPFNWSMYYNSQSNIWNDKILPKKIILYSFDETIRCFMESDDRNRDIVNRKGSLSLWIGPWTHQLRPLIMADALSVDQGCSHAFDIGGAQASKIILGPFVSNIGGPKPYSYYSLSQILGGARAPPAHSKTTPLVDYWKVVHKQVNK